MNNQQEQEQDKWYELGIIEGFDRVVNQMLDRAAGLFRGHNDEQAKELRAFATRLQLDSKHLREDYDKKYHPEATE